MSKAKKDQTIRAWRDADYYQSLSEEERATLPASPAAMFELTEDMLRSIGGAGCDPPTADWRCGEELTSGYCTPCGPHLCFA